MKVNIGYLNCYDSILGLNLIKIFYNTKHKVCFSLKIRLHSKQELMSRVLSQKHYLFHSPMYKYLFIY